MTGFVDPNPGRQEPGWPKDHGVGEVRFWILAYILVFTLVSTLFMVIRVLSRSRRAGDRFGIDDALAIVAWVSHRTNSLSHTFRERGLPA